MLRGYGAEVVITPTAVEHDSPESYYSVSSRLAEEIPGGFKPDQYSNMANPEAHYRTPGPEIWEQTDGEIEAIVDLGRHRRHDQRPRPLLQGAPPRGADRRRRPRGLGLHREGRERPPPVLRRGDRQGHLAGDDGPERRRRVDPRLRPRLVPDGAALAREEGLLAGGSAGSTVVGRARLRRAARRPEARILTILPDSGRSYLSKFLDDNWMIEHGFLERAAPAPTVRELLRAKQGDDARVRHDLRAPEGRRGDRRDGALLDLAAARWCATASWRRSPT